MNKFDNDFWIMLDKIVDTHNIKIDRAKGTHHPKYSDYVYPLDYGYLEGTVSSDGAGIDVWVGTSNVRKVSGIISSVDSIKGDSEIKILYACSTSEIAMIYNDHNRSVGMKGILNIRGGLN